MIVTFLVALTPPILNYSFTIMSHIAVALLLIYSYRKIRSLNPNTNFWLLGLALAFLPWLHWKQVFSLGALTIFLIYQFYKNQDKIIWKKILMTGLLIIFSLISMAIKNKLLYNSYLPNAAVSDPSYWGYGQFTINGLFGQLADRSVGLFIYNPLFILIISGFYYIWRRGLKKDIFWIIFIFSSVYLLNGLVKIWGGGYAYAPNRYIIDILPFLSIPLFFTWLSCRNRLVKILLGTLSLAWSMFFLISPQRFYPLIPYKNCIFVRISYSKYNFLNLDLNNYFPNLFRPQMQDWLLLIFWSIIVFILNYFLIRFFSIKKKTI